MRSYPVTGKGLGLRRALMRPLEEQGTERIDFLEIAPDNWIEIGGSWGRRLRAFTERVPFVCHGLSLNIGGPAPLDRTFIRRIRQFLDLHDIRCYSEHLSYCADDGHLYDLLPIPFTQDAVAHCADRIGQVQDLLGRRLAIENVSYYCAPGAEMSEIDFINAVIERADCDLLLDVNNIYVSSVNNGYDPHTFLAALPGHRIAYAHIAGHFVEAPDLIVDSHGADVIDPVWDLLAEAYALFDVFPTLLERDFNLPPCEHLLVETDRIAALQTASHTAPATAREARG
jgi:uncharacterized protein